MWRPSTPDPADIRRLTAARERLDLTPLVIHTNYLINLATLDPEIRSKSVASFRGELDRAKAIGAEYLVMHPGNHKDQPLEHGLAAFALGLAEAAAGFSAPGLTVLLENTVGGGTRIGQQFDATAHHSRSRGPRNRSADRILSRYLPPLRGRIQHRRCRRPRRNRQPRSNAC